MALLYCYDNEVNSSLKNRMQRLIDNKLANTYGLAFISFLVVLVYQATLAWMYGRFMGADSYYSHGFLVPVVSLYLIYQQKEELLICPQSGSLPGLLVVLVALVLHVAGTVLYIFSISGMSLFLLIIGLAYFLFGSVVVRKIWFPMCFLVFMVPLPMAVIGLVSFPLKMIAAKAAVFVVGVLGIPVYGEGFNITIPAGKLLVGNPCSGLRSLIAFLALGAVFAYLAQLGTLKKWFLFFLSVPIALLSNFVRVPLLILVSHYWGLEAAAPDTLVHTGSGMFVFIIGIVLLFVAARLLERVGHGCRSCDE